MGKAIDMTGNKYGRLTCVEKLEERDNGHIQFKFECECGNVVIVRGGDVRQGKTISCGCLKVERVKKATKGISPKERKRIKQERLQRNK